ncbi:MAG: hypothetical protein V7L22_32015 [Nostoc sp.]|uniref:hypothetical protein n=1 Tax=Nostoc sp. TaxID=1180 RepID=UPI002FF9DDB4
MPNLLERNGCDPLRRTAFVDRLNFHQMHLRFCAISQKANPKKVAQDDFLALQLIAKSR